jgi:DNA-binding beta-propeller fold protein YncE
MYNVGRPSGPDILIQEGSVAMEQRRSRARLLYLITGALIVAAVAAVYITAPEPTILTVRVIDLDSEQPLARAVVQLHVPGQDPLPAQVTDDTGQVQFQGLPARPGYEVRVQVVDYALTTRSPVEVIAEQEATVTVEVPPDPGHRLYVGLNRARVAQIDTASLQIVQTVVLPGAREALVRDLQVHPQGGLLYVVSGDQGYILSSETGASQARLEVEGSIDSLELTADGRYVLAAGLAEPDPTGIMALRHLWVLEARTGRLVTDTLLSDVRAETRLATAWQSDGHDAYILRATNPAIDKVARDGPNGLPFSGMPLGITGRRQEVVLSADGQELYWWGAGYSPEQGQLTILASISLEDGTTEYRETPGGVSAVAASPVRQELYVLNGELGTLTIMDPKDDGSRTLVPAGKQPEHLVVSADGARAYVADTAGDSILVVDLDSASLIYVLPLPGEPVSLATGQKVTLG